MGILAKCPLHQNKAAPVYSARVRWLVTLLAVWQGGVALAAKYSLVGVAINDVPIQPTDAVAVHPGDDIEVEIQAAGWSEEFPDGIWAFGATLAILEGENSGGFGKVSTGGCHFRTCLFLPCEYSGPCGLEEGDWCVNGCCYLAGAHASIEVSRADRLFDPTSSDVWIVDVCDDITFEGVAEPEDAAIDDGAARYVGTLHLRTSGDACGEFEIRFFEGRCYVKGGPPPGAEVQPTSAPLHVNVTSCIPQLLSCTPADGSVDPRIPHAPNDSSVVLNDDSVLMQFNVSPANLGPDDFSLRLPTCDPWCDFASVEAIGHAILGRFPTALPAGYWTDVLYFPGHSGTTLQRCSIGSLPGDVSGDGVSTLIDVQHLVGNLLGNLEEPPPLERCDVDRSLLCAPADVLMEIDLLNGAGAFEPWNGVVIIHP